MLSKRHDLRVIEDAAHAFGTTHTVNASEVLAILPVSALMA